MVSCLAFSSCATPEHTAKSFTGAIIGGAIGGAFGGWEGAAAGAAAGGVLGYATSTGDPKYGTYSNTSSYTRN
ncbi:hypothetical protein [Persicirhabdus sediminis]|nr:hypothetical protein [Persicirhabdus sediminis]